MSRVAAALLLAATLAGPAAAEGLVSTLSEDAVEITSSFTGERIVIFGAVRDMPAAVTPAADPQYQVAVVVQGPPQDLVVRRKERVLGIWANRAARSFADVPSYYAMHLSPGFAATGAGKLADNWLGLRNLPFVRTAVPSASQDFANALIDLKTAHGLYTEREDAVEFLDPGVFRATFFLPSEVPTGRYRVSVYLFRGEALLTGSTEVLTIAKSGYSAEIARFAADDALVYGLLCVALAMFTGWVAGLVFRRP